VNIDMVFYPIVEPIPLSEGRRDFVPPLGALFAPRTSKDTALSTLTLAEAQQRVDQAGALGDGEVYDGISAEALDLYLRRAERFGDEQPSSSSPGTAPRTMMDAVVNPGPPLARDPATQAEAAPNGSVTPMTQAEAMGAGGWEKIGRFGVAAAKDIGNFVRKSPTEVPRAVWYGLQKAAAALLTLPLEAGAEIDQLQLEYGLISEETVRKHQRWIEAVKTAPDADTFLNVKPPETVTGNVVSGAVQFISVAGRAATTIKALGAAAPAANVGAGFISASTAFQGSEDTLAEWIQSNPKYANFVTEFLASDADDSEAEKRLKNGLEGVLGGLVFDSFLAGLKVLKAGRAAGLSPAQEGAALTRPESELPTSRLVSGPSLLEAEERRLLTHHADEAGADGKPQQIDGIRLDETPANDNLRADNDNLLSANESAPPPRRPFIGLLDVIRNSIDGSLDRIEAMTDPELAELWAGKVGKNAPRGGRLPDSIVGYDVDLAVKGWFEEFLPHWNTRFEAPGASGKLQKPDLVTDVGVIELKPRTRSGEATGTKQTARYEEELGVEATYMTYELNAAQRARLARIKEHIKALHGEKYHKQPLPRPMPLQVPLEIRLPDTE
jgi:hypothetical protein